MNHPKPIAFAGIPASRPRTLSLLIAAALAPVALADAAPAEKVEVSASKGQPGHSDPKAAKFVLTREEIARYGDTNLADVLKRVPGVSVSGSGGQAREIRLRGLGGGYTQILLNGEPVPSNFSIDSISPELIERVEVIRSATADASAQSIAGSINILLRRSVRAGQRELKLQAGCCRGSGGFNGHYADQAGDLSYTLAGNLNYEHNVWPFESETHTSAADGTPLSGRGLETRESVRQLNLGFTPRLNWKLGDKEQLALDALLQWRRVRYGGEEARTVLYGAPPEFAGNELANRSDSSLARISANWNAVIGVDGRLDLKATAAFNRRDSETWMDGFAPDGYRLLRESVVSRLKDDSLSLTGKYAQELGDAHSLGVGWDGQYGARDETRIQRQYGAPGFRSVDHDEEFEATVTRLALYVQDEWTIRPDLSLYAGLRWEGLETDTEGNGLARVRNRSSVFSPTLQWLWKIPGSKTDQLRLSLARTYKAPTGRDLIPRRWANNDNTATTPNFQGNPDLAPELAWGVDLGYEHAFSEGASMGLNLYARNIDDVILYRTYQDRGVWISSPMNSGAARVRGLELEGRAKLNKLWQAAPDLDLRLGLTRNWSRVAAVPGAGNRLAQQASRTANLALDYRVAGLPLVLGCSFVFEKGDFVRMTAKQSSRRNDRRNWDMYGLWTVDKSSKLRLTVSNLLKDDDARDNYYDDASISQRQSQAFSSFTKVAVQWEMKL